MLSSCPTGFTTPSKQPDSLFNREDIWFTLWLTGGSVDCQCFHSAAFFRHGQGSFPHLLV